MAWSLTRNILPVLNILFLSCSYFHKVNPEFQSELQGKKGPGGEMISLLHISVVFFFLMLSSVVDLKNVHLHWISLCMNKLCHVGKDPYNRVPTINPFYFLN